MSGAPTVRHEFGEGTRTVAFSCISTFLKAFSALPVSVTLCYSPPHPETPPRASGPPAARPPRPGRRGGATGSAVCVPLQSPKSQRRGSQSLSCYMCMRGAARPSPTRSFIHPFIHSFKRPNARSYWGAVIERSGPLWPASPSPGRLREAMANKNDVKTASKSTSLFPLSRPTRSPRTRILFDYFISFPFYGFM